MSYKSVRLEAENVRPLNGRKFRDSAIINMQDAGRVIREAYWRMEKHMENYSEMIEMMQSGNDIVRREKGKAKKGGRRVKGKRLGTILGWLVLAAVVLIAVPVGVIMLMVSGIWSAADRLFARLGR